MSARKPPLGTNWRILAHDVGDGPSLDLRSADNPHRTVLRDGHTIEHGIPGMTTWHPVRTVFDELVIGHFLHVEQMNDRQWWIGISTVDGGIIHVDITVDPKTHTARSVMVRDDRNLGPLRARASKKPCALTIDSSEWGWRCGHD